MLWRVLGLLCMDYEYDPVPLWALWDACLTLHRAAPYGSRRRRQYGRRLGLGHRPRRCKALGI